MLGSLMAVGEDSVDPVRLLLQYTAFVKGGTGRTQHIDQIRRQLNVTRLSNRPLSNEASCFSWHDETHDANIC